MSAVLLGLLVAVAAVALPATAVAQTAPPQPADDYQVRLMLWRQLAAREVAQIEQLIGDDVRWREAGTRMDAADRLAAVIELARRPPRDLEEYFWLEVQPVNNRLDALASAVRTGRREEARAALDALRPSLFAAAPLQVAPASPPLTLQPPPRSIDEYTNAAVQRATASCASQAARLGWRPTLGVSAEEFVRAYWLDWLADAGASTDQLARAEEEDCAALYARVQQVALDQGFALAERQGWVGVVATQPPATTVRNLALREYHTMVDAVKRDLPETIGCFLRLTRFLETPGTGAVALGPACENVRADHPSCGEARSVPALTTCVVGIWERAYQQVASWVPPTGYEAFHLRLLASLTALDLAAQYTRDSLASANGQATPATPRAPGQPGALLRNARGFVEAAERQCLEAFQLYDGSTCGVER